MKKGSAMLYVVLAILVFSSILSYVFSRTSNTEISQLKYISEIKNTYEELYQQEYNNMYLRLYSF